MSQSAKPTSPQETSRRGRAGAFGIDAMNLADTALKRAGFLDPTLVLHWAEIAGAELARVAEPVKYQEGPNGASLTLKCEAAASVFLQHETRALIGRLNAYLGPGRVARIRLIPGQLAPTRDLPNHPIRGFSGIPRVTDDNLETAVKRLAQLRLSLSGKTARKTAD